MRAGVFLLLLATVGLAGCDRLTGEYDQKIYDAEAVGYACRVSLKTPQDCMQENETHSPTSLLDGWKAANKDIESGAIDPTMGKRSPVVHAPPSTSAAPETGGKIALPDLKAAAKSGKTEPQKPVKH